MFKKLFLILSVITLFIPVCGASHSGKIDLKKNFFTSIRDCDMYYHIPKYDNTYSSEYIYKSGVNNGRTAQTVAYNADSGRCIVKIYNEFSDGSYVCTLPINIAHKFGVAGLKLIENGYTGQQAEAPNNEIISENKKILSEIYNNPKYCKKEKFNIILHNSEYNYNNNRQYYRYMKKCDSGLFSTKIPEAVLTVDGKTKDKLCVIHEYFESDNIKKACKLPMDIAKQYANEGLISIDEAEKKIITTNGNVTNIDYEKIPPQKTKYMQEIINNPKYCHDTTLAEIERANTPNKYTIRKQLKRRIYRISKNILSIIGLISLIVLIIAGIGSLVHKKQDK